MLAEYQRAGSISAIQNPESQLSFFAVSRAPRFASEGQQGPTEEKTLAARAFGFVEEAIMPSKTGEQRAARAGRNEFAAEIIADTVAMLPCTKWWAAGGFRSLFLASSDKGVTGAGLDFAQGAALNKVAKLAMPGSRMTTLFENIENKAMRETATHAVVGLGFGLASTGFRPESWQDKDGKFSFGAGVTNVGSAGLLGAFINVPAGAIGSRVGKMTLSGSLAKKFALDDAYVLSNLTAGTTGGVIFGGADAMIHGRPLWEGMLTGGVVGGFTGGTIGVATRPRYNFNPQMLSAGNNAELVPAGKTEAERPIIDKVGKGKSAEYSVSPEVFEKLHIDVSKRDMPLEQRAATLGPHDLVMLTQDVQKPGAASKTGDYKTFGEWARDWMVGTDMEARRYTFGPNEVIVPEKYASQLDEVLNLRIIVEQEGRVRAGGDAEQIAAVEAAKKQLEAHPMRDRAHAVDLVPFLEELPDRSLVRRVVLLDNKNPQDPWHRKTYKPDFVSAASAAPDGTVSYYAQNRDFFSRETTHHEWSHLLENKVTRESAANQAAFGYEKAWSPSDYSRRDNNEMFAEMGASLLHPDADQFLHAAHNAPVRTAIYTSAMEQALSAAPPQFRSVFADQYQARVDYVKENILPQARLELAGSLNGGNRDERVASAQILGLIGNRDNFFQLKGIAQNGGYESSTTKAAFEAGREYVTRGKRGLSNYELLNPEQTVDAQATYLAEMAQRGSGSRQMAVDGLYQLRGTSERARLFHELFALGNRKNVTGAEQARALKIIDAIPDTLGKQLALRETLNLAGDANTRADLAMSAMTRNPSLHVEGLKTLADLAQPRTKEVLEAFAAGDDPVARELAEAGLRKIGRSEAFEKALAGLKDPNTHERQLSITELAQTRDRRAIRPLIEMYLNGETMIEQRLAAEMLEQNFAPNIWKFEVKTMTRGMLMGERLRSLMMGIPSYDGK